MSCLSILLSKKIYGHRGPELTVPVSDRLASKFFPRHVTVAVPRTARGDRLSDNFSLCYGLVLQLSRRSLSLHLHSDYRQRLGPLGGTSGVYYLPGGRPGDM